MQKIFIILMTAVTICGFTGCGSRHETTETITIDHNTNEITKEYTDNNYKD